MAFLSFSDFDPFDSLLRLQAELDRRFNSPGPGFDFGPAGGNVFPPINVFRDKDGGLVARAEVPGISPSSLSVDAEGSRLTISGERSVETGKGLSHHRRERQVGRFSRVIQLPPDVESDRASAECRNGILTVRLPKSEAARPRNIKVQHA